MACSKLSYFLVVFMIITVCAFVVGLEAQDAEENNTSLQEFVKKAEEYVKQNQIGEAIELYTRIVKAAPENVEYRAQLATLYTRTKQHEMAAESYSKLLEVDSDNIMYQDELVISLQAAGKQNEAVEIAQTYIDTYPEVGAHYARLARLYEAEGNETDAMANYEKATTFGYGNIKTYFKLAEHYFLNDDIDAAERTLKNAIPSTTRETERIRIQRQLVNLYLYQGNLEEMSQKAEADGTLTYEMQNARAEQFRNTGELEKAVVHFKKAAELSNSPYQRDEIANELIDVFLQQDKTDLALDFYETEISKLPRSRFSSYYSAPGITFRFAGDYARETLINAYDNQGRLADLRTLIESKLEEDTDNLAMLELLVEIYLYTNNFHKVAETYHAISNSKAESNQVRRYIAVYQAAAAYWKSNQSDMAKILLHRAETELAASNLLDEDHEDLRVALATICLKNAMYDAALKLADTVVTDLQKRKRDPNKYLYEILAATYLGAKRFEQAYETYLQIAEYGNWQYDRERAEKGMHAAAIAGNLYEKWLPEQLKQVEENPNDSKRILKLAQNYEATKKISEAVVQYERLAELDPDNALWYIKLGDLYQNLPQENRETDTVSDGSEGVSPEQLAKSIAAYKKAIELDPTLYDLYDLLAQTFMKAGKTSQAKETYRSALAAKLGQNDHDSALLTIIGLYADEGQEDEQIAFLEEIRQEYAKMDQSAILHELLGDLYKKVGDAEKTERAYAQWLQIRIKTLTNIQSASYYRNFANKLTDKGLFPDTALNFARRAYHKMPYQHYTYPATLGYACVANGLYDKALNHYKNALSLVFTERSSNLFWENIASASKNAEDTDRYVEMLDMLISSIPSASAIDRALLYRIIAGFYAENEMSEKAEEYLLKAGFIPETCWITLGPFKNIDSRGVLYAYIPEETTQIDATAKYYGRDQLIIWEKPSDDILDGRFDFGNKDGINNDSAAYAWVVIISPDERDIVMRFDSDDQGTIWLNGKQVFSHDRTSGVRLDRYTIPVTLKNGENSILVKVCNVWQTWDFYLRLTDAEGNSFEDLKFKTAKALLSAPPPKSTFHLNVNLGMAEYYSKNNMPDKAMEQMRQTGMIHEKKWLVLGPFNNIAGIGYNTAYIPEDTTQIDLTVKYAVVGEQIGWKEFRDDVFDGFIDLGRNVNWRVSYALTTVTSPDERKVQLRFGSDDQSKVWFNGKMVFADPLFGWAVVDSDIIPVTLKKGINTILVKVCNEEQTWGFYLRVTDADGKPFDDLKINEVQDK